MLTTLIRWFGAGQERPARKLAGLTFSPRLEDLEGRAAPGGLSGNEIPTVDTDHIGEEIPQTGTNYLTVAVSSDVTTSDATIQIDANSIRAGGSDFGVGIDPSAARPSSTGDFLYGVQVDLTMGPSGAGGEFGVGIDPSASRPSSIGEFSVGVDPNSIKPGTGDFLYGVQVGSAAVPAGQDVDSGIGIDPIGSKGGGIEW
jgi:hypothetical protein